MIQLGKFFHRRVGRRLRRHGPLLLESEQGKSNCCHLPPQWKCSHRPLEGQSSDSIPCDAVQAEVMGQLQDERRRSKPFGTFARSSTSVSGV